LASNLPKYEYRRPWLYDKQRRAIFDPARFSIIEASTKSGKTVGCIVWLAELAMAARPGESFWWVAPSYQQARIAFRRLRRALPVAMYHANESELTLRVLGHGTIFFKSAEKPDNLYGEDVFGCVIDEATRVREDAWIAIRTTLTATGAACRIIGNVKGRKNWAYRLARRAEQGGIGLAYHKITAHDAAEAGVITEEEIEQARQDMPDHMFRELYLAEPSDDEGNPYGLGAIRACVSPLSSHPPVVWGWDLAKSIDWTVGIALDKESRVCRFERFQKPWRETRAAIIASTRGVSALIDSTGVGDPVVEDLQHDGGRHFEGFKFTADSKQRLMESLVVAIQKQTIRFPTGEITAELESFEYQLTRTGVRYSAPEGLHDDCVMALALAVYKAGRPQPRPRVRQL
jgi:hypothetical protein